MNYAFMTIAEAEDGFRHIIHNILRSSVRLFDYRGDENYY